MAAASTWHLSVAVAAGGRCTLPNQTHKSHVAPVLRLHLRHAAPGARIGRSFSVSAVATVATKFTKLKPLGDRVILKIQQPEEKSLNGLLRLSESFNRPQVGEIVAVADKDTTESTKVEGTIQPGAKVVYSKYAGTEVEFNEADHLILKESDIIGFLETDDIKDLKPLKDRILVKAIESEDTTSGGVILTQSAKEKSSEGLVVAVGSALINPANNQKQGPDSSNEDEEQKHELGAEGKRPKQPNIFPGSKILFSKFSGNEFKSKDRSQYRVIRLSDVIALLPYCS